MKNKKNDVMKSEQTKNIITDKKLKQYFSITGEAIEVIKRNGFDENRKLDALDFFDMALRYYKDADYFYKKKDYVNAFACLNYSHGWLDAGARIGLFKVKDNRLFTVD